MSINNHIPALRRFGSDKRGNVLMIMGFALIPITMAAGMTVDYTRAARLKTKLDAAADAAVLSAVAEVAGSATDRTVCERAVALFDSQARNIPQIAYSKATSITLNVGTAAAPSNVSFVGSTSNCSNPAGLPSSAASRIVSLSYSVASNNVFGALFDRASIPVSGQASSEIGIAPDIDFYIALDTSPSMALPVTTDGMNKLIGATNIYSNASNTDYDNVPIRTDITKKGCAFACHSNKIQNYVGSSIGELIKDNAKYAIVKESPAREGTFGGAPVVYVDAGNAFVYKGGKKCNPTCVADINVYNSDGTYVDTYWFTRNRSITLRVDELRRATADLVGRALIEAADKKATYRAAIFGFDSQEKFRRIYPTNAAVEKLVKIAEKPTAPTYAATLAAGDVFKAKALSNEVELALVDDQTGNGCPVGTCSGNHYLFTSFKGLFDGMLGTGFLPATSGQGTRATGDTPQAFLFIVTDGMSDEKSSLVSGLWSLGANRTRSELTGTLPSPAAGTHLNRCNAIKARGVQIAILYTEYTHDSVASDSADQRGWVQGRISNNPATPTTNQHHVERRLIDCASPGFMLKVSADGDISGALTALFAKAVSKPRLVK